MRHPSFLRDCTLAPEIETEGGMFEAKPVPRHKAWGPIRYYIIDFGISRLYEPDEEVVGDDGAERDIPEMSDIRVYDPFPADVFILGNACKKYFVQVYFFLSSSFEPPTNFGRQEYGNFELLTLVLDAMTAAVDPHARPSAAEALKQFKSAAYSQGYFTLRQHLVQQGESKSALARVFENIGILLDSALYPAKYIARLPSSAFTSVRNVIASRRTNRVKL